MQGLAPHLNVFGNGHAVPGASDLEARVADLRALEERPKGLIQPFQCAPLDLPRRISETVHLPTTHREGCALVEIGKTLSGGAVTADTGMFIPIV